MSEAKRALIVGCGRIAGGYNRSVSDPKVQTHALAYIRHPSYELVACVEPDVAKRTEFMKVWGVPEGYDTLDAALKDADYDIVSLCSPTGTHIAALERLLDSSVRAVFAEKPLDGAVEKARALGARFDARGIPVAVNFTRRYYASLRAFRDEVAAGVHGALSSATVWYTGGVLNNGSHMVDLVTYLVGEVPDILEVMGDNDRAADPTPSALLRLRGAPFHLVGLRTPGVARFELELSFARQIVTMEEGGLFLRKRAIEPLAIAPEISVAGRGAWYENDSREPFLVALDELSAWKPGVRLSSDINSACEAVAVVSEICRRAKEKQS